MARNCGAGAKLSFGLQVCGAQSRASGHGGGPAEWSWSSYGAHTGRAPVPVWLGSHELWTCLLGRDAETLADRTHDQRICTELVAAGHGVALWAQRLSRQIYLGDDQFVGRMLKAALPSAKPIKPVPKVQRTSMRTLADWLALCGSREEALRRALQRDAEYPTTGLRSITLSP